MDLARVRRASQRAALKALMEESTDYEPPAAWDGMDSLEWVLAQRAITSDRERAIEEWVMTGRWRPDTAPSDAPRIVHSHHKQTE